MLIPICPTNNFLTLKDVRSCTVSLVNLQGEEVFRALSEGDDLHINVAAFTDASYFICVSHGFEVLSRKLLVWKKQ